MGPCPAHRRADEPCPGGVRIANAVAGVYYTAFTSETLDGPYTAEAVSTQAPSDGGLSLIVDATPAAKFVVLVASDVPFAAGAPLPKSPSALFSHFAREELPHPRRIP